jgi:hypothetical protein
MLYGIYPGFRLPDPPLRYGDAPGQQRTDFLEDRIDALELACAGLWRLLKAKHGYTDDELAAAITDVDAADGKVDGKMRSRPSECPACGRQLLTRSREKCSWCGARLPGAGIVGGP